MRGGYNLVWGHISPISQPPSPIQVIIPRSLITFIAIEKCEKECNMLEIILVQRFCPPKIKISQFPSEC